MMFNSKQSSSKNKKSSQKSHGKSPQK
jgi:hypothetical protein